MCTFTKIHRTGEIQWMTKKKEGRTISREGKCNKQKETTAEENVFGNQAKYYSRCIGNTGISCSMVKEET
eukprot:15351494-Ditylum_brightwellii.AAC.2